MNERKDWKGLFQKLSGRFDEIDSYRKEIKDFNTSVLRIEKWHVVIAVALLFASTIQGFLFYKQNLLITEQNNRLEQQNSIIESERRSSLVLLFSNILDAMDNELKEDIGIKEVRDLSPQLIGRIISLSKQLKPYYFFDNGTITKDKISPERGQLFISLFYARLDQETYLEILSNGDFEYSDLANTKFDSLNIPAVNLSNSNFQGTEIRNSDLRALSCENCNFKNAKIEKCILFRSNLKNASFVGSRLSRINFYFNYPFFLVRGIQFAGPAKLQGTNFKDAYIFGSDFRKIRTDETSNFNFKHQTSIKVSKWFFDTYFDETNELGYFNGKKIHEDFEIVWDSLYNTVQAKRSE